MRLSSATAISLGAALVFAAAPRASARLTADRAAAIITYPLVRVDTAAGVDSFLQLSNSDAAPVDVSCFLENHNKRCSDAGTVCATPLDCPPAELCLADLQVTSFQIGLTARQPISWQAKDGLAVLPMVTNSGSIPPVPEIPFTGVLRCIAVDAAGDPVERNVLKGEATLERYDAAAPAIDAAKYNALGQAALAGAVNGDGELVLGGPQAEYEGCPSILMMNFIGDHGIEPATGLDDLHTELTLTPCSSSLFDSDAAYGAAIATFEVYNEFEQRFSTSRAVNGQLVTPLSLLDTSDQSRSIFSAGIIATLAGKVNITGFGHGLLGMAIEAHHRLAAPQSYASAAFNLHALGERVDPDILRTAFNPCPAIVRTDCRAASRSTLRLTDQSTDRGDRFLWKYRRGPSTDVADFGQPQSTTNQTICVYAGAGQQLLSQIDIPAASSWRTARNGFRYTDPAAVQDGVRNALLRASSRDRTLIQVRGTRDSLPDFPLTSLSAPVVVQLVNDTNGICWESSFAAGDVRKSSAERFEAAN